VANKFALSMKRNGSLISSKKKPTICPYSGTDESNPPSQIQFLQENFYTGRTSLIRIPMIRDLHSVTRLNKTSQNKSRIKVDEVAQLCLSLRSYFIHFSLYFSVAYLLKMS
jgi:hypothetical protein